MSSPARARHFVRTKLKSLTTGKVIDNTFSAGHKINTARVERHNYQYLYKDDMGYNFMNAETFEQIPIAEESITNPQFLKDGEMCEVLVHVEQDRITGMRAPSACATAGHLHRTWPEGRQQPPMLLSPRNWRQVRTINVPLFINQDDLIKVDTRSGAYVERVKQ